MYSLQKTDFEVLLLAELQRQQQSNKFCDVLLKAKDVFVPMHSCILSAISPSICSTLSSLTPPPAGQRWLLEFPTLDPRIMFHLVRLFYTGRMTGVAENEKQDAISAAAKLEIHGLVEVTEMDNGEQAELCHKEAGVQTEPQRTEEDERPQVRWRRGVVEGNTCLWKEMLSGPGKEVWTQTEEASAAPLALPLASFETVEVEAFQNLTQADYHQCVPVAVLCPPKDKQTHQLSSSTPPAGDKEPSHSAEPVPARNDPPPLTHFSHQRASGTAEPQRWTGLQGADRVVTEPEESENEDFEHFQNNIPGFISYFINQNKKEERGHRGRGRMSQRGDSAAGAGQQRARRPRGRPRRGSQGGPRGRRTSTQLVDGQNVKTSKLQKVNLHKWQVKTPRTGQGGGAVGKKLFLKTRDDLKATRRQRGCSQVWKLSPIKDTRPRTMGGERNYLSQHRCNQESFQEKKSSTVSVYPSSSFTGPLQTSSAHTSAPPAASHMTAASPILHTTPLPPQEEQIDRLLEEVMMELHILPNNDSILAQTQGPLSTSSTLHSSQTRSKQQDPPRGSEVPVLQQQSEGELNEILDNFLHSFEQHIESCSVREACDASRALDDGQHYTIQSRQPKSSSDPRGPGRVSCSQAAVNGDHLTSQQQQQPDLHEAPAAGETCSKGVKKTPKKPQKLTLRKSKTLPSENIVNKRKKKSDTKAKSVNERANNPQHQQKKKKTGKKYVTSQEQSCQTLEKEAKNSFDHDHVPIGLKVYPIRSRIIRAVSMELAPAEEAPPEEQGHKSRPRKRAQPLIQSKGKHKDEPVPLDSRSYSGNQAEKHREGDFTMLPREDPTARARKRESEETRDASTMTKRARFDQMTQPTWEAFSPASGSEDLLATEQDEVIDVETVSLSAESDYLQDTKQKPKEEWRQVISKESSDDEIIDVEVEVDQEEEHGTLWGCREKER